MQATQPRAEYEHGMTLVEILVVVAILGVIAGVVTVNAIRAIEEAKWKTTKVEAQKLEGQAIEYYANVGRFPDTLEDLLQPNGEPGWSGPYVRGDDPLLDAWDREFMIETSQPGAPFVVISLGRDGAVGGDGPDADVYSTKPLE